LPHLFLRLRLLHAFPANARLLRPPRAPLATYIRPRQSRSSDAGRRSDSWLPRFCIRPPVASRALEASAFLTARAFRHSAMLCVILILIKFPYFNQVFQARGISEAINSKIIVGQQQQQQQPQQQQQRQRIYWHTRRDVEVCAVLVFQCMNSRRAGPRSC